MTTIKHQLFPMTIQIIYKIVEIVQGDKFLELGCYIRLIALS